MQEGNGTTPRLILCSGSPRRRELLSDLGLSFEVDTRTSFVEKVPPGLAPESVPLYMATGKSLGFHRPLREGEVLLSADTVVICEGLVLGKPGDRQEAARMLRLLSGRTHTVVSAIFLRSNEVQYSDSDSALVTFDEIGEADIEYYIERCSPVDKAGAYGIQEWIGLSHISSIQGSFYTIMGLPTHLVYKALKRFGLQAAGR